MVYLIAPFLNQTVYEQPNDIGQVHFCYCSKFVVIIVANNLSLQVF